METARKKTTPEEVQGWWKSFKKKGTEEMRNQLLVHYFPLVRYTAERLLAKLPSAVDLDDLISSGTFGLIDAIKMFDLGRGVKFETYCAQRIRGAILDELRALDWVPRLVRSRANKVNAATSTLQVQHGRKPTRCELAKQLKVPMVEFDRIQKDAVAASVISLNRKWYETDSSRDIREIDLIEDRTSVNPLSVMDRKDFKEVVTRGLNRAERLIIILYYFEEMTMKEIGETLDLSESRVSQMHSAIMKRLRVRLGGRVAEMQMA